MKHHYDKPLTAERLTALCQSAGEIKKSILRMTAQAKSSHVGCGLSIADILTVLYGYVVDTALIKEQSALRDYVILSKGHAAAALYAALAEVGIIEKALLATYYENGSLLAGHPLKGLPGVEASTGSLGHGLSLAVGLALAALHDKTEQRHYVILGDGECQEGSIWEAATMAARFALSSLTVIVDYNNLQGLDQTQTVMPGPLEKKFEAFGWVTEVIDGHNHQDIIQACKKSREQTKPTAIIAHTHKGHGISFLQDQLSWHYRSLNNQELLLAEQEVKIL